MPSWNIDICKGNKGNTKNRGQIYSFEIIEIVSETVLIEQPIPRYKNVVRYDDTPQTQNTKVVNSEKVIGFTTGFTVDLDCCFIGLVLKRTIIKLSFRLSFKVVYREFSNSS